MSTVKGKSKMPEKELKGDNTKGKSKMPEKGPKCGNTKGESKISVSEEDCKEYREMFNLIDQNGDMEITGDEITTMFRVAGFNMTDQELDNLLTSFDKDKNKSINFEEFITIMKSSNSPLDPQSKMEELTAAFKQFDTNGDGRIDLDEFKKIMGENDETVVDIFKQFDKNEDGILQYSEFVALWSATN